MYTRRNPVTTDNNTAIGVFQHTIKRYRGYRPAKVTLCIRDNPVHVFNLENKRQDLKKDFGDNDLVQWLEMYLAVRKALKMIWPDLDAANKGTLTDVFTKPGPFANALQSFSEIATELGDKFPLNLEEREFIKKTLVDAVEFFKDSDELETGMAKAVTQFVTRVSEAENEDSGEQETKKKEEDLGPWEKVKVKYSVQEDAYYLEFNWRDGVSNAHRRVQAVGEGGICVSRQF